MTASASSLVAVLGSGTMGQGIAHSFAQHGYDVCLTDVSEERLSQAVSAIEKNVDRQLKKGIVSDKSLIMSRLRTYRDMDWSAFKGFLIVEAVVEDFEVKKQVFSDLDSSCHSDCILASNTSSLSITRLGACTQRADRVIGMHFMNPVPMMSLVEVVMGYRTSGATKDAILGHVSRLEKTAVEVADSYGFVANRILMPMLNEAFYTLQQGISSVEGIDTVMRLGMSHPMGPLALADFIGLDVCHAILRIMHEGLGDMRYAPCPLLGTMVDAGDLGRKTGRGFYTYEAGRRIEVAPRFAGL